MITTAQNLERIISARDVLRTIAVNFGIALSDAQLAELAEAFGTIINRGTVNVQIKAGESYSILRGYYPGGIVKAISDGNNYNLQAKGPITPTREQQSITSDNGYYGLSSVLIGAIPSNYNDTSSVNVAAAEVLANKLFVTAAGVVTAGTMPNNGAVQGVIKLKNETYYVPIGFHNGSGAVVIDPTEMAKLIELNIRDGVTILGVKGTMKAFEDLTAVLELQDALITELENTVKEKAAGGAALPNIQPITITENGTYTAPESVGGYSPVMVNVPEKTPVLQELNVTENGIYPVPESMDGYGTVTVNVQTTGDVSEQEKELIERTVVNYSNNQVTTIGNYAFYGCSKLQSVSCPNATSVKGNGLMNCSSLTSVNLPMVTQLANYAFQGCSSLEKLDLPALTSMQGAVFSGNTSLVALILRSSKRCNLGNKNVFTNTPIANGTGYIYVPSTLVDTYKTATNWSTYADQIRAIEDYPEITGG